MANEILNEAYLDAVDSQDLKKIQALMAEGANPKSDDLAGRTALHLAAAHSKPKVLIYLLENGLGIQAINKKDSNGWTPLLASIRTHRLENAQWLIRYGASLTTKTKWGTPLTYMEEKHPEWIKPLTQLSKEKTLKPKPVKGIATPKKSKSSFNWAQAIQKQDLGKIQQAISQGLWLKSPDEAARFLNQAAARASLDILKALVLQAGADVNAWYQDQSPLHAAAVSGNEKNIRFLVQQGAQLNANGTYGTPLIHAAMENNLKGAKALLEAGANPNLADDDEGNYPLHFAVLAKNLALVKLLVQNGARIKVKNKGSLTPMDLAKTAKLKSIEAFLISKR